MKSKQFKLWISEKFLGFDAVITEKIKFENRKKNKLGRFTWIYINGIENPLNYGASITGQE